MHDTVTEFFYTKVTMVPAYLGVNEIYVKHKDRANFMKCLHHEVCDKLKVEHKKFSKREDWLRDKNSKEQEVTINSS